MFKYFDKLSISLGLDCLYSAYCFRVYST